MPRRVKRAHLAGKLRDYVPTALGNGDASEEDQMYVTIKQPSDAEAVEMSLEIKDRSENGGSWIEVATPFVKAVHNYADCEGNLIVDQTGLVQRGEYEILSEIALEILASARSTGEEKKDSDSQSTSSTEETQP